MKTSKELHVNTQSSSASKLVNKTRRDDYSTRYAHYAILNPRKQWLQNRDEYKASATFKTTQKFGLGEEEQGDEAKTSLHPFTLWLLDQVS